MALTSQTVLNVPAGTASLSFLNPSTVDETSFASNQITYAASTTTLQEFFMNVYILQQYINQVAVN